MVGTTIDTGEKVFCEHDKRLGILLDKVISVYADIFIRWYHIL